MFPLKQILNCKMAKRIIRVEERLKTFTKDLAMWYERFGCYLIEKQLILPIPADTEKNTAKEQYLKLARKVKPFY